MKFVFYELQIAEGGSRLTILDSRTDYWRNVFVSGLAVRRVCCRADDFSKRRIQGARIE